MSEFRPPRLVAVPAPSDGPAAVAIARTRRPGRAWLLILPVPVAALVFALVTARLWALSAGRIAPRHRAEAICFVLERSPGFTPPIRIEPNAALLRGRFGADTPALLAMQQAMRVGPDNILRHWAQRLGDYDVEVLWLRVPEPDGDRHWLVMGWMEGRGDLALCSFRFPGTGAELTPLEVRWGDELLDRVLHPQYFRAGELPAVRLRAPARGVLPAFGPGSAGR